MTDIVCISPIDGREVARRQSASQAEIDRVLSEARAAQKMWRDVPLAERMAKLTAFVDSMLTMSAEAVPEMLGQAPSMQEVFRIIGRLSQSHATVLITGESGTGKELVASALHRHSPRAQKPFVAINTAAIPKDLLESELFGHERGAFTGATERRVGRFESADHGTIFLDEIGEISGATQVKLLRFLETKAIERVGGAKPIELDVRLVAATNRNLEQMVRDGKFREDLFFRLNVVRLFMPPLRERAEDIPLLLAHFIKQFSNHKCKRNYILIKSISNNIIKQCYSK